MLTDQVLLNQKMANEIAGKIKKLNIINPTFVAGSKNAVNVCRQLSRTFHSGYAFIREENDRFGTNLVLYGKINPTAILFINKQFPANDLLEDLGLVKCAGARRVLIKRLKT